MERLTGKDELGYYAPRNETLNCLKHRGNLVDRLAAYEDTGLEPEYITELLADAKAMMGLLKYYENLEEQGRLKILPCAVGDTVWDKEVEPWNVISVEWFSRKVTHLHCVSPVTGRRGTFAIGKRSLGKTVFLTREEAENALKGGADNA